jgi:DNA-binding NtrC family response regulator
VKGAFTGADRDRRGAIEAADKGTLFLDEVADLSPRIQSLFLRVLQEREVRRVGSERAIHVDVRFVAATHRSLEDLAASGAFRRDLLYRLQGSVLQLPSLRERRHEFPYLIPRIVAQVARDARRDGPELAPGLAQALSRLPWPGNFRELRHALERALLRCGDGPLRTEHFPELQIPTAQEHTWEQATRDFQRRLLLETLRQHHFQVSEAALSLGLTRPALYTAAKRMGLDIVKERERWQSQDSDRES